MLLTSPTKKNGNMNNITIYYYYYFLVVLAVFHNERVPEIYFIFKIDFLIMLITLLW